MAAGPRSKHERGSMAAEARALANEAERIRRQQRREVEPILASIRAAREAQVRAGYRIGAALSALVRRGLLGAAGLSFEEVAKEAGYGRSQAFKLVAIAEHFSEDEAVALGYEQAYLRARANQPAAKKKPRKRSS